MALNFTHGVIQWLAADPVTTIYSVSLPSGFDPKACRFYWVGLQSNSPTAANSQAVAERRGVGFYSIVNSQQSTVGTFSADNSGNADCGSAFVTDRVVVTVNGTGLIDGELQAAYNVGTNTIDLIVQDTAPANITVFCEIWGGEDIQDVVVSNIAEPAATGNQTYTAAVGFNEGVKNNQCVMFAGVQSINNGTGQAQDSGLHVGFATSTDTTQQITVCGNSDDGSATMDTDGYNYTGECISMIVIAGGNPNVRAVLNGIGTGGLNVFQLNWLARATTNRRSIYMTIKGGSWRAGSYTIAGNTLNATTTVSDLSFVPKGISFIGAMKTQSTVATSTVQDRIGFGTALVDSTVRTTFTRNSAGVLDEDATANSEIDTSINYAQSLVFPSNAGALQSAYDMSSMGVNNFTVIVDTAGGVANEWQGYLAFGDERKPRTISIGHPFIN